MSDDGFMTLMHHFMPERAHQLPWRPAKSSMDNFNGVLRNDPKAIEKASTFLMDSSA